MADLSGWARRFMAKYAPGRKEVLESPWLKPFGRRIRRSDLWRLTQRSVPRGVAVGLFVGIFLMIPGLQIVGAALVCMTLRANVPVAAAMTFLSNPLTTPFFLIAAINVGNRFGFHADLATFEALRQRGANLRRWFEWLVSDAAPAMIAGLVVIGAAAAFVGYWAALAAWRWRVARKWRMRRGRSSNG